MNTTAVNFERPTLNTQRRNAATHSLPAYLGCSRFAVGCSIFVAFLLLLSSVADAATFTVTGGTLAINLTAANESVAITAGATNYTFALTGGTWSGTDSADATGNGTTSLSAVKASFTAVTVDDSSTGNGANFLDSGANTYTASFTITLDSATPGTSTFSGTTAFTGSNALSLQSGVVLGNSGSIVSTVDGNLTLLGNMQTPGQTGNLFGIFLNNTRVTVSGSGNLTIKGKCGISTSTVAGVKFFSGTVVTGGIAGTTVTVEGYGAASSTRNYGVNLVNAGTVITSSGGNVVVTGVGGTGAAAENKGILMEADAAITATGSGSITVTGTGGGANSSLNAGVEMQTGAQIASVNGSVSVTGTGGGGATGTSNRGVSIGGSIKSTGSGSVSVAGTGGTGSGGDNQGVILERFGTGSVQEIKSGTGNVSVTGTAGGGSGSLGIKVNSVSGAPATISAGGTGSIALVADTMSLVTSAVISASSVSIAPKTPGKNIDLGSTSDTTANTLGLSQAELNTISTTNLGLGDANTASINFSTTIVIPSGTAANVTAAAINTNGNTISGGTMTVNGVAQPLISVEQPAGTYLASGVTKGFGSVVFGTTADLVFTVKNSGSADLTGLGITIDGANASEFSVFTSPVAPVVPGGSTTFTIRHSSSSAGNKTAAFHLASNAFGLASFDVNLTASSLPDISVEQPVGTVVADGGTAGFGGLAVGSTADLVFTVKNPGNSGLTISGITVDGTNAGEFSVVANPASSVPPGSSTTFTVRHTPLVTGSKTAALHIASNVAGAKNPYDISLTANSIPDISVEQPIGTVVADGGTAGFGGLAVGSTADLVFTVKNPGNSGLTISGITVDGTNAGEFSVVANPASSVPPGSSTTFTVRHTPLVTGSKTAALHIASNVTGAKNPYDISLTANSIPDISVEQPAGTVVVDGGTKGFGFIPLGGTVDLVFTVKNPGTSGVAISGITFDGSNASEFSVVTAPAASVAAGGSTTFTVRCTPASLGIKTAALHIASDVVGAKNPYDISLTAAGVSVSPLSGTKTVGPTGDYTSLTDAITDIQAAGLGGPLVLELQPAYLSTVETFPLVFTNLGTTATNTLTVRPQAGATGLSIASADTTAATIDLNGGQFITFDGRPGGTGTAKQLTIENTSTAGVALRFINEGSGNTVKFVTLKGVNNTGSTGTVLFSTTTGANGNDNNTLDTCDIRDGATTPTNAIYSSGSSGTEAQKNSGNTVTNCNIFNFYSGATQNSQGLWLNGGSTGWTISGNSFYQTASRAPVAASMRVVLISGGDGNNFTIAGNFIGGSAPTAGGTAWTTTGTTAGYQFQGINLTVGTTTASSVQGNTIANIVWSSSTATATLPSVWTGILVSAGNVNIGTVTGNTIGSGTGTGSISVTTSGTGGTTFGIGNSGSGTVNIANNSIGSITVNGLNIGNSASLTGIQVTAGANTISNNTVGSATTANSLNAATSSTSITGQQVAGIVSSSTTSSASITGNTVANLNNNSVQTSNGAAQIRGIVTSVGVNTITGNTVRNLATTSLNANNTTSQSVYGIIDTSTAAGQTVSQNTVHSLANTAASAAVNVTGIYFAAGTSSGHVIARNFVHSLAVSSTSATSVLHGMQFVAGTFTAQNNMVRVGLQADGTSTAGASIIRGIYDNGTTAGRNFYHNSVYLGGTQTTGAASTFAFTGITGVSNTRDYRNNLFVNARSNGAGTVPSGSGGTGKHYAVQYGGSGTPPTGLTASNNLFLASGTGGVLGSYILDRTTLAAWQAATGKDANSLNTDPLYVNHTGTSATVDLHLQSGSPAINAGAALAAVTNDFDGDPRSLTTPTIGADEFFLTINYGLLGNGSTANRVLSGWATITANSGSVASGANAPRLYFKKGTDADVFGGNTSADNGWKYVTATGSGPYSFTMDYSIINGGSVSNGDTVQYFVVAQDAANNLGSSPAGATASANPPVQNVNGHGAVNSFSIVSTISGTVTVGSGGSFPSLSGAGGLFAALNSRVLTGNLTVSLTSDTTEDGSILLNAFTTGPNYPGPTYTVTLQPDSATMRTISGSGASGLITLNGAKNVTIDGRFGGSGRYLTFRNTVINQSTLTFVNDASNNTVRNCVIEGPAGGNSVFFSNGISTGNDNNTITGCQIRDRSDTTGVPSGLISSLGTSATVSNSNNTISNNEMFNFTTYGIRCGFGGTQLDGENWTITGNNIYLTAQRSTTLLGIFFGGGGTNLISGNSIHDLNTTGFATGIGIQQTYGSTTVTRNRIYSFPSSSGNTNDMHGISFNGSDASSSLTVVNNMITLVPGFSNAQAIFGIRDRAQAGSTAVVAYNTVLIGGTGASGADTWAFHRFGASTCTLKNNLLLNLRSSGGNHFAAGGSTGSGSFTTDYNVFSGTGSTAANIFDSSNGLSVTGTPISFATWQSNFSGDTHSSASNPGGNYGTAMFVDATNGDLHLVPGGNVLVNSLGTPIAGITTDFDGDPRSATTPTIGADEVLLATPDIAITQTTALTDGVSSVDFGTVTLGSSSAAKTFTITNPGNADLSSLAFATADGAHPGDFIVSALSGSTVPVGSGSVTFTVTFTPTASGPRSANIHLTSNVTGAKNPFDIALSGSGQTVFAAWAASNGVANDPNGVGSNGVKNLLNFAFNVDPATGGSGALVYTGTFGGPLLTNPITTGQQSTKVEPSGNGVDFRGLFVRRKDAAAAGLTYTPQFSADMITWQSSSATPVVLADDGTNKIVSVPYPVFIAGKKARFFRISVNIAP